MARRHDLPLLPPFHSYIAFTSIDPARNRRRAYRIVIVPMDRAYAVVTYRGRVSGTQQVLIEPCTTWEAAMELAERRAHDRLLHGYTVESAA